MQFPFQNAPGMDFLQGGWDGDGNGFDGGGWNGELGLGMGWDGGMAGGDHGDGGGVDLFEGFFFGGSGGF